ncbi:MAG: DUF1963 domain-containing protein [Acidobacteria bacterium]|nr:DUF1963 domain-containing protein [Acidobacteriota bacterium]
MKIPRFVSVFLCGAAALLALALLKALLVSGLSALPPVKILIFASSALGLVAAMIDWALLRQRVPPRHFQDSDVSKLSSERATAVAHALSDPLATNSQSAANAHSTPEVTTGPSNEVILHLAQVHPIVFMEICPPSATGLSFYGGVPIVPPQFAWPRTSNKPGKTPLSFVMQWDCAELAAQDETGALPPDGALYLFCDLTWGEPFDFKFVHASGPTENWTASSLPEDLPPVYGDEGAHLVPYCSSQVEKRFQDVPRLLPKWPFAPAAFSYPTLSADADADYRFWSEAGAVSEALFSLQHHQGQAPTDPPRKQALPFDRPFPAFPHDFAAVRIVASELLRRLHRPDPKLLLDKFEHDRKTTLQRWADSAADLYNSATSHSPAAAVEQSVSDRIWRRIEQMAPAVERGWDAVVQECVNTSLGIGSEASSALPANLVAECAQRHELATVHIRDEHAGSLPGGAEVNSAESRTIHAPCPNHMFGPPSFVQGHVEEYLEEWILLLELSTRKLIGHEFGEGVYQFMIRPAHLRERKFDRVKLVASAY